MEHKRTKKHEGGLYIAICSCILVIALIGYANNIAEKNREEEKFLAEQAGENMLAGEIEKSDETPLPILAPVPTPDETLYQETEPVIKAKKVEEASVFSYPVSKGKVVGEYSDRLIYISSVDEWRTHNGIDIEAEMGESVTAAGDGVVKDAYFTSLGSCIEIEHGDGLVSVYANLNEEHIVKIGDSVKKGDVIAYIGETALGDVCDTPHLHFEVIKDGEYKNPADYLG